MEVRVIISERNAMEVHFYEGGSRMSHSPNWNYPPTEVLCQALHVPTTRIPAPMRRHPLEDLYPSVFAVLLYQGITRDQIAEAIASLIGQQIETRNLTGAGSYIASTVVARENPENVRALVTSGMSIYLNGRFFRLVPLALPHSASFEQRVVRDLTARVEVMDQTTRLAAQAAEAEVQRRIAEVEARYNSLTSGLFPIDRNAAEVLSLSFWNIQGGAVISMSFRYAPKLLRRRVGGEQRVLFQIPDGLALSMVRSLFIHFYVRRTNTESPVRLEMSRLPLLVRDQYGSRPFSHYHQDCWGTFRTPRSLIPPDLVAIRDSLQVQLEIVNLGDLVTRSPDGLPNIVELEEASTREVDISLRGPPAGTDVEGNIEEEDEDEGGVIEAPPPPRSPPGWRV